MLDAWEQRPQEMRALFNPAFSATMICVAVRAYQTERAAAVGMPLLLSHLLLPIALHAETRRVFPRTTVTSLTRWIGQNPQVHIGLAERVAGFRTITAEAVRFAIAGGILNLTTAGELVHIPRRPRGLNHVKNTSAEVSDCFKAVTDLGRWFARVPNSAFLFHLLRLRP